MEQISEMVLISERSNVWLHLRTSETVKDRISLGKVSYDVGCHFQALFIWSPPSVGFVEWIAVKFRIPVRRYIDMV